MKLFTYTTAKLLPAVALSLALAACNGQNSGSTGNSGKADTSDTAPVRSVEAHREVAKCSDCGTISSIEEVKTKGDASGVGAVAGAVVGGVVGHQIGDGRGQDAATAAGAIGGGFAGNEIEKRAKSTTSYRVTVAMEDGTTRSVDVVALNGLSTGTKVKVIGSNLQVIGS